MRLIPNKYLYRLTRTLKIAGLLGVLALGACVKAPELVSKEVSGNSFDPWNVSANGYAPNATRFSISYWFDYANRASVVDSYNNTDPVWMYKDRLNPKPQRGFLIHWIPRTSPLLFENVVGGRFSTVTKNQRTYQAYEYCLSAETVRRLPLIIYNYGILAVNNGVGNTGQLYVKRYIPRNLEENGSRLDAIYVEDIGLSGFRCVDLANFEPVDGPTTALLQRLGAAADSSFDVQ